MQRFVLRRNILHFRALLAQEPDGRSRATIRSMLATAERELAVIDADTNGAALLGSVQGPADPATRRTAELLSLFEASPENYLLLDPGPGLRIVDVNDAYADATMTSRSAVAGERMFDIFPDNPDDPLADGVNNLFHSLQVAAETGQPHAMAIQRYDVRDALGRFQTRYWRPLNTPILSESGRLLYLLHHVEDVTAEIIRGLAVGVQASDAAVRGT